MHIRNILNAAILATLAGGAFAQAPATPAAPAAPPSWKQGMAPEQEKSTLHPFAGHVTGRPASELPINKLTAPPGFKVEVWADGIPDARSLAARAGCGAQEAARDPNVGWMTIFSNGSPGESISRPTLAAQSREHMTGDPPNTTTPDTERGNSRLMPT